MEVDKVDDGRAHWMAVPPPAPRHAGWGTEEFFGLLGRSRSLSRCPDAQVGEGRAEVCPSSPSTLPFSPPLPSPPLRRSISDPSQRGVCRGRHTSAKFCRRQDSETKEIRKTTIINQVLRLARMIACEERAGMHTCMLLNQISLHPPHRCAQNSTLADVCSMPLVTL